MTAKKPVRGHGQMTEVERVFAHEYLVTLNASLAYKTARPTASDKTAGVNGYKLLQKPRVQELIKKLSEERLSHAGLEIDAVLRQLNNFLTYDMRDLFDENGRLKQFKDLTYEQSCCIAAIKDTKEGREYKLIDRMAALDKAMKYRGLFEKDNAQRAVPLQSMQVTFVSPRQETVELVDVIDDKPRD